MSQHAAPRAERAHSAPVFGALPVSGTLIVAVFLLAMVACLERARAQSGEHGDGHRQMHNIYRHWHKPDNPAVSCCNGDDAGLTGDCRPTRAQPPDSEHPTWRALIGGRWVSVPWPVVLPNDYAADGRSHICERDGLIFCFTPGEPRG